MPLSEYFDSKWNDCSNLRSTVKQWIADLYRRGRPDLPTRAESKQVLIERLPVARLRLTVWVFSPTLHPSPSTSLRLPVVRLRLRLIAFSVHLRLRLTVYPSSVYVFLTIKLLRLARLSTSVRQPLGWPSLLVGIIRQVSINQFLLNITDLSTVKFLDILCFQYPEATIPGIKKREGYKSSTPTQAKTHGDYSMCKTSELQLLGAPMRDVSYEEHCSLTCVCRSEAELISDDSTLHTTVKQSPRHLADKWQQRYYYCEYASSTRCNARGTVDNCTSRS